MELKKGDKVALEGGAEAVIARELGRGGQGIVYEVTVKGKKYALKWYTCKFKDKDAFRKNMERNIANGPPDPAKFLWPLFLTEERSRTFGYGMELRSKDYSEFSDILMNKVGFSSTRTAITSALNIVTGFRSLHVKGLSYQDLNDGNFFINVSTGDVLICDNDNVTPDGKKNPGSIGGKPGYMAPEIVTGKAHPSTLTDYHSLAVILFKLFCRHDPLMGEEYVKSVCITEQRELELYGTKPVFIFDPNNTSNRPVKDVHPNPLKLWPLFPEFLHEAFITSFVAGMKDPDARIPESVWQKVLVRFRDEFLSCPACGKEIPLSRIATGATITCRCGHSYSHPLRLIVGVFTIPLFPGTRLYGCHTIDGSNDYTAITGEVIIYKNNSSLWGIKNVSEDTWTVTPDGGEAKTVPKGSVVPIATNAMVQFKGKSGKIVKGLA